MRAARLPSLAFLSLFALLAPIPVPMAADAGDKGAGHGAAKESHGDAKEAHGGKEEESASGGLFNAPREVDIPVMVVPVTAEDGTILSYAYMTLQVEVIGTDVWTVRAKIPFLQDAFLKEMFSRSIATADGSGQVDVDLMRARLKARASGVLEKGTVTQIIVKQLDIGPA
ncbi:MAG: hypothetical protein H6923_09425 [Alphaproteobacteria bacterium]|nr:hypothetical protein [Alphaproteobacteria bacterium]